MKFNSNLLRTTLLVLVLIVCMSILTTVSSEPIPAEGGTPPAGDAPSAAVVNDVGPSQTAHTESNGVAASNVASGETGGDKSKNEETNSGSSLFNLFFAKELGLILGGYIMRQIYV
uniref:Secreted protein n=1 Tax=Parastrongyloides trichosuri TaxID=131310 RepID=A0A0N4Z107_PARTI